MHTFHINDIIQLYSIVLSSTCFEQLSVHHQEDFYMQVYGMLSRKYISSLMLVHDQLDALLLNVFISRLYMFRATSADHQGNFVRC